MKMKNIRRLLLSPWTVVSLILACIAAGALGASLPQRARVSPGYFLQWKMEDPLTYKLVSTLGLDRVFSTRWFMALVLACFLVLAYSLYVQLEGFAKGRRKGQGRWGAFLFHLGILIMIAGAIYALAYQKRAFLQLIENDTYMGDEASLSSKELGVLAREFVPGFKVWLNDFEHTYWDDGSLEELTSRVTLIGSGDSRKDEIRVSFPAKYMGVKLYQTYYYGYTVSLLYRKEGGAEFYNHFSLDLPEPGEPHVIITGIRTLPYTVRLEFLPDNKGGSYELIDPSLKLTVTGIGETLYDGTISPGGSAPLGGGQELFWAATSNWSGLRLVHGSGTSLVFPGFAIMVAGLVLMYIVPGRGNGIR